MNGKFFNAEEKDGETHYGDGLRWSRLSGFSFGHGMRSVHAIAKQVTAYVKRLSPTLTGKNTERDNSLHPSLAGATFQPAHTDRAIDDALLELARNTPEELTISVIVSTERATTIDVCPESHTAVVRFWGSAPFPDPGPCPKWLTVTVPPYHFVAFYGTTVHAGSATALRNSLVRALVSISEFCFGNLTNPAPTSHGGPH